MTDKCAETLSVNLASETSPTLTMLLLWCGIGGEGQCPLASGSLTDNIGAGKLTPAVG